MFRPVNRLYSGWCLWYKNTIAITRVRIAQILKTISFRLKVLLLHNNVEQYRIIIDDYKTVEVKIIYCACGVVYGEC